MRTAPLKGQRAFERVSREGFRWTKEFVQIRSLENSLEINRIGIVIPEKAIHDAVDRNRVRRLISEAYRSIAGDLKTGYDIVFLVREKPSRNKMGFVFDVMKALFNKAGLIKTVNGSRI
jgi:ribonuclease P protein component